MLHETLIERSRLLQRIRRRFSVSRIACCFWARTGGCDKRNMVSVSRTCVRYRTIRFATSVAFCCDFPQATAHCGACGKATTDWCFGRIRSGQMYLQGCVCVFIRVYVPASRINCSYFVVVALLPGMLFAAPFCCPTGTTSGVALCR